MSIIRTTKNADGSREILEDNGDGTAIVSVYAPNGSLSSQTVIDASLFNIQRTPSEILDSLEPKMAEAVINAAAGFVQRAGELWDKSGEMTEEDPAKPFADVVVDIALTAALPLLENE